MLSIIASVTSINIPGRDDRDRGWKSNKSTGVDKDGAKSSFPTGPITKRTQVKKVSRKSMAMIIWP